MCNRGLTGAGVESEKPIRPKAAAPRLKPLSPDACVRKFNHESDIWIYFTTRNAEQSGAQTSLLWSNYYAATTAQFSGIAGQHLLMLLDDTDQNTVQIKH